MLTVKDLIERLMLIDTSLPIGAVLVYDDNEGTVKPVRDVTREGNTVTLETR